MATLNEIFKWVFENIVPGETDAEKRVDAGRIMDNYYTLRDIIAVVEAQGVNADESNATNGASTVSQANLTVKTEQGETGLLDDDDWVQIWDGGTNYWYLKNTVGDNELSFSDTHLSAGSGPADYSNSAFIDGLIIKIVKFRDKVGKTNLITAGSHADKITGDDIEESALSTVKLGTVVSLHGGKIDDVTESDGGGGYRVKTGSVIGTALVKIGDGAIMADDSPRNLSRGMFDNALYRADMLFGLQETPAAANDYDVETTIVQSGAVSQKFSTNGSAQGIEILLDELIDHDLLAGKKMTITVWIRSSLANKLDIGFYDDDDGYQVDNVTYAANTWTKVSITKTIGSSATEVRGVVRSTDAVSTDHYVDIAGIYIGETAFDPAAPSVSASVISNALNNRYYNYIPFSNLSAEFDGTKEPGHAWLNGDNSPPVGWTGTGATDIDNSDRYVGNRSWKIELDAGEYFLHTVGVSAVVGFEGALGELSGKPVTFSLWLKKDGANTEDLDIYIEENTGAWSTVESGSFAVNDYDDWAQIAVTGVITDSALLGGVRVVIKNNGAATISAKVDGLMFTQTAHPVGMPGTVTDALMDCQQITGEIPVGINCIAYGMTVSEQTANTGTDSFYPRVDGVDKTDLQVDLGSGEDYENISYPPGVYVSSGSKLGVYCDAHGLNPGSNAFAVVHCLVWGI